MDKVNKFSDSEDYMNRSALYKSSYFHSTRRSMLDVKVETRK
jgi:hypothetical protein